MYRALLKSTQASEINLPSCEASFEPSIDGENKGNPNLDGTRAIMPIESLPTDASGRPMSKAQAVEYVAFTVSFQQDSSLTVIRSNSAKVAPHLRSEPANIVLPKKENEGSSNSKPQR